MIRLRVSHTHINYNLNKIYQPDINKRENELCSY